MFVLLGTFSKTETNSYKNAINKIKDIIEKGIQSLQSIIFVILFLLHLYKPE